jgi:hypothetical protein
VETDLTAAVIDKIDTLSQLAHRTENLTLEIEGKTYSAKTLEPIIDDRRPETLQVSNLSSIVQFINENRDGVKKDKLSIFVTSPTHVELRGPSEGESLARTLFVLAENTYGVDPFPFGRFIETEAFIISLMTKFTADFDRDLVVKIASNLVAEASLKKEDTGATTKKTSSGGVINNSGEKDLPVAKLMPFRTFMQVPQPASLFIFRYKSDGEEIGCTLIEADGGAWRDEAMANIADYFREKVPEVAVYS